MNFLKIWNLDAQNDFDKKIVTKKPVKENLSYFKYALVDNGILFGKVRLVLSSFSSVVSM